MEIEHIKAAKESVTGGDPFFKIAITGDFFDDGGQLKYADIGLDVLDDQPDIRLLRVSDNRAELARDQFGDSNAVLVLAPKVTAASLERSDDLLAVARFGVGYDNVDVAECTANDVVLIIASGAVDRPVAEATLAWILALSYKVRIKDQLVRQARWDDRKFFMGQDLREHTIGIIGFGGIGRELVRLVSGFGMNAPLVFDPFLDVQSVAKLGARLVSLDELLKQSDFVSLHCPLTPQTRGLIGAREPSLMKPTAFFINTARGGIVDEPALEQALRGRSIAGAAIDCFVGEPLLTPPPYADLDNVLLAPHSIAWTGRLFRDLGRTAISSLIQLRRGNKPNGVVNRDVLDRPGFLEKWRRLSKPA